MWISSWCTHEKGTRFNKIPLSTLEAARSTGARWCERLLLKRGFTTPIKGQSEPSWFVHVGIPPRDASFRQTRTLLSARVSLTSRWELSVRISQQPAFTGRFEYAHHIVYTDLLWLIAYCTFNAGALLASFNGHHAEPSLGGYLVVKVGFLSYRHGGSTKGGTKHNK